MIKWSVAPLILFLYLLVPVDLGEVVAFRLSQRALQTRAEHAISEGNWAGGFEWVGLFHVKVEAASARGVYFFTDYGYDGLPCGFAFIPTRVPEDNSLIVYRKLFGPWYEYRRHAPPPALRGTSPQPSATQKTPEGGLKR